MKRTVLLTLAAALAALAPLGAAPASAADAMAAPALTCHPAAPGDHASAVAKMDGTSVLLVCVPTEMMMPDHMKMIGKVAAKTRAYGPNIDGLLTPDAIDAAWKAWTAATFNIPPTTP
jgi:hypothetical protein